MKLDYTHTTEDLTIRCTLDCDRETGCVYGLEIDAMTYRDSACPFWERYETLDNENVPGIIALEETFRHEIEEEDVLAAIRDRDEAIRERMEEDGTLRKEAV